jgi:DNA-binding NarL/FixJ family response regulator
MTVRVFVVDDHPLFRAGVTAALASADGFAVAGEASCGEDALTALRQQEGGAGADVVLADLHLRGMSGIELTRQLLSGGDQAAPKPRVLVLSMSEDDESVIAAVRAGAHGYMVKGAPREELLLAIRTAANGGAVFSPVVAGRLRGYFSAVHDVPSRAAFPALTERELEVLDLVARGYNNRRISRELIVSEKTVRNHISHIFAKLNVSNRAEAVVRARDSGLGS